MIQNRVKKIWSEGGVAMAMYTGTSCSHVVVEIIGYSGFDAAYLDMEHTALDLGDIELMVLAAERVGICPIARIPQLDPALIGRLLDIGVQGIYVPHVSNADAAQQAVKAVRYPPRGERGLMPSCRAAEYGRVPAKQHIQDSNEQILLAVMIEDQRGVDEIEAIAAVDGVDLIAIGPVDLATSLGVGDAPDHPQLVQAIERVAEAVRSSAAHLAIPSTAVFPRSLKQLRQLGVSFVNLAPIPENRLRRALTQELAEVKAQMQ